MRRPFLLVTNDDGIHAPGIKHLWEVIHEYADIAIVAPSFERSCCGLSITWNKPLTIHSVSWHQGTPAWSINGTPADCVKMALGVLLDRTPDLIVSGINRGSNAGRTVLYSGTIGGVIEGILKGLPGIAFSFSDMHAPPLEATKRYIFPIIQHILQNPLPTGTLLNVNFPEGAAQGVKGLKLARQGKSYWVEQPEQRVHPEGVPYYWLGGKWRLVDEEEDSDVAWLGKGYIAAAPIHVAELTDRAALMQHKKVLENLFIQEVKNHSLSSMI
ncbi:MAG: 5'/3'-nucleotidase SurE [Chlamydiia bacterium]|nr:5'/3'-nucleotidase SurE [Chlamydiia bacterium]